MARRRRRRKGRKRVGFAAMPKWKVKRIARKGGRSRKRRRRR